MKTLFILSLIIFTLQASEELFDQNCGSCHNKVKASFAQMKLHKDTLKAPYMSVIIKRLKHLIVVNIDDEDVQKAVITAYIKDYVYNPDIDKGLCHVECFVHFGVMPSQKDIVDEDSLELISSWVYDNY